MLSFETKRIGWQLRSAAPDAITGNNDSKGHVSFPRRDEKMLWGWSFGTSVDAQTSFTANAGFLAALNIGPVI